MNEKTLKQLNNWLEKENSNNIIKTINKLPKEDLDYTLINHLATAYNHTKCYDKALEILDTVSAEGQTDALWNFRVGYAHYYKDEKEKALTFFERSTELGEKSARWFIKDIRKTLYPFEDTSSFKLTLRSSNRETNEMYIIGDKINTKKFRGIYGIFEDELNAYSYLKCAEEDLNIVKYEGLHFPFFIIEDYEGKNNSYSPVSKDQLKERIEALEPSNNLETHFNLWRISANHYNERFPEEPCLNGRDWHEHFTDNDIKQIEANGFEKYWNCLLND